MALAVSSFANSIYITSDYMNLLTPTVYDARAHSLGKCEIMGVNGSNAIFSNPAHIAGHETMMIQFGGKLKYGELKNTLDTGYYEDKTATGEYRTQIGLSQFSIVKPFGKIFKNITFSAGLGLNKAIDLSDQLNEEVVDDSTGRVYGKRKTDIDGGLYFLTPSIGIQLFDKLNLGLTYNKSVIGEKRYSYEEYEGQSSGIFNKYDQDLSASNITFGATFQFLKYLSIGMMYRSEMKIEMGDYYSNMGVYTQHTGLTDPGFPSERTTVPGSKSPGYSYNIPSICGVGGELILSDIFTLYGEYQTRKESKQKIGYSSSPTDPIYYEIDAGRSIKMGIDASRNNLSIRLGAFSDSVPLTNIDLVSEKEDKRQLNQNGITFGAGYKYKNFLIEFSGEYSEISQKVFFTDNPNSLMHVGEEDYIKTIFGFYTTLSYQFR